MARLVTVTVTADDIGVTIEHDPRDVLQAAIQRALPGAAVAAIDPVDIDFAVFDADPACCVTWSCPTPDAAARHLYHEAGRPEPYQFTVRVPDCLAASLCHGPERSRCSTPAG